MMSNKELARHIKALKKARQEWIDILVREPEHNAAAEYIIRINAKLELLRGWWNWNDEEVEMP